MEKLLCSGYIKTAYPVYFSVSSNLGELLDLLPKGQKIFVLYDCELQILFPDLFNSLNQLDSIFLPIQATEDNKTLENITRILEKIFPHNPSREDILLVIGGGLTLNVGGLLGSLLLRGVRFYYVPTTLIAQIDAGLGSKIAVNFQSAKNWVGLYNDPEFCYINTYFLSSIRRNVLASQFIEGLKLAVACDKKFFKKIYRQLNCFYDQTFSLDRFVHDLICKKIEIVKDDLREKHEGACMLYGHTVGHSIEMLSEGRLNHGESVGLGMLVAVNISFLMGYCDKKLVQTHSEILKKLKLPFRIPEYVKQEAIINHLRYNKTNIRGQVRLVLLRDIGKMVASEKGDYYILVPREIVAEGISRLKLPEIKPLIEDQSNKNLYA